MAHSLETKSQCKTRFLSGVGPFAYAGGRLEGNTWLGGEPLEAQGPVTGVIAYVQQEELLSSHATVRKLSSSQLTCALPGM